MGLTSAIDWWEKSQLRVLVLSSLIIQWLLFISSKRRKFAIPGWFRSIIWLAYLGSDAVAIYGLATLFNRHKNQDRGGGSTILEVVWAPVLLIHLGGPDDITAYNLEDNELWTRHVLTAVSQITVAIYVFCKSWKGDDGMLLLASILLFVVGVPKCLEKPWALKSASVNSLVSSSELARKTTNREGEVEGLVRGAKAFAREQMEADERGAFVQDSDHPEEEDQEESKASCFQHVKRITWGSFMKGYRSAAKHTKPSVQGDDYPESPEEQALLELCTSVVNFDPDIVTWPIIVSQYDLVGFIVRNKNHKKKVRIVSFFGLKNYLQQHWWVKSCYSSCKIVGLVLRYVKTGWKEDIHDVASYRTFNNNMGQRTLQLNDCKHLAWTLNRPFDESILLWHIATDFCFYSCSFTDHRCTIPRDPRRIQRKKQEPPGRQTGPQRGQLIECKANTCRSMSNYMIYLLFVNPEMLLPGSRRNLFTTAYKELKGILKDIKPPVKEKELMLRIASEMQSTSGSQEEGFIHDAWSLAQGLQALGDEKMWEVIEGVWVEMLCFSAGRCRGYLHAKALGTGGELLTYIWLLLSNMGMETFAERLQRTDLSSGGGNTAPAPSTSEVSNGGSAPQTSVARTGAASSTSAVTTVADPSTSEIRAAPGDDLV